MPLMTIAELSTDQKYLDEICQVVSTGVCTKNLGTRNPLHLKTLANARLSSNVVSYQMQ
jgi:hypothetical protein